MLNVLGARRNVQVGIGMSILNLMSCYLTFDADIIKTALLNIVIGMGIVFCVLILISFLIFLFGYIPKVFGGKKDKKIDGIPVAVVQEMPVEDASYEELIEDTELVAVITAAIMASMGEEAPADGLIVRSIRRRTNRKKFA